ncbi:MAG TPA: CPBP family intramembrane glutamic endopeptidase [Methanocella sp.]|nr:CPBP family intramembrane glutamic endopeptidase [Methanocella sp.]
MPRDDDQERAGEDGRSNAREPKKAWGSSGLMKHIRVAAKLILLFLALAIALIILTVMIIVAAGIAYGIATVVSGSTPHMNDVRSMADGFGFLVISTVLQDGILVIIPLLFLVVIDKKRLLPDEPAGKAISRSARWFAGGMLLNAVALVVCYGLIMATGASSVEVNGFSAYLPMTLAISVAGTLILSISAGIGEEVFFRKYIQGYLKDEYNVAIALVVTSILFTTIHIPFGLHGQDMWWPVYVSSIFVASLVLGYLYVVTGSIWAPIGFHFFQDVIGFNFPVVGDTVPGVSPLLLFSRGSDLVLFNVNLGDRVNLFDLFICLAILAGLYLYDKRRQNASINSRNMV